MTLTTTPALPQGVIGVAVAVTSAVTNPGNTTTITNAVTLCTAGAEGAMITKVQAIPTGATTVTNVLGLWTSTNSGTNKFKLAEKEVQPDTYGTNDPAIAVDFGFTVDEPLVLGPNEILYCGIMQANPATTGWHFRAEGRNM